VPSILGWVVFMETRKRSIAKTISFRIIATLTTMLLVYIFTKDIKIVGLIGILDIVLKLIIYYIHERVWSKIHWGIETKQLKVEN
jgi:uncharacterized membrane protein